MEAVKGALDGGGVPPGSISKAVRYLGPLAAGYFLGSPRAWDALVAGLRLMGLCG